jgi:hypothetical protein
MHRGDTLFKVVGVRFQTTYLLLIFKGEGEGGSEGWWP